MTIFQDSSTAGQATIITNENGTTFFLDHSTGGTVRLITNAGGLVNISRLSSSGLTVGSIEGAGTYLLGAKSLTVGGNNLDTEVAGSLQGDGGSLIKTGDGRLTLSGASTYTGPTLINGGSVALTGSSRSAFTVNSGGMLTGTGTAGGLSMAGGGIVAPGSPQAIGSLNIAGNVTLAPGSVYQVAADPAGSAAAIAATGSATLSGGTVQVLAQPGTYAPETRYTILTAGGGISGTFANATSNLSFLTPALSYDTNDVFLTLRRNGVLFTSVAQTSNQRGVAAALQTSAQDGVLVQAILPLAEQQAVQAFDVLSGELHASLHGTLTDDAGYVRGAALGRLRQAAYVRSSSQPFELADSGPATAAHTMTDAGSGTTATSVRPYGADLEFWVHGYGAWSSRDSSGNAAGLSRNLGGFLISADHRFGGDWLGGVAAGYSHAAVDVSTRASSGQIGTAQIVVYAGGPTGPIDLRGGAGYARQFIDVSRGIAFGNFAESARASYGGNTIQVFGEAARPVLYRGAVIEPFGGLAWVHADTEAFTERGGAAALRGASAAENTGYSTVGLRAAASIAGDDTAVTPRASVAWQHTFGDVIAIQNLTFLSTGAGFAVSGTPLARDVAVVEAGIDCTLAPSAHLGLFYNGAIGGSARDNAVKAKLTWQF